MGVKIVERSCIQGLELAWASAGRLQNHKRAAEGVKLMNGADAFWGEDRRAGFKEK